MNKVIVSGKLTKDIYVAAKGWVGGTIALPKPGTDYTVWVPFYAPSGVPAASFKGAQRNEEWAITGYLGDAKDKDGNKYVQIVVVDAARAGNSLEITDEDLGF
jgi:hypothetical protein